MSLNTAPLLFLETSSFVKVIMEKRPKKSRFFLFKMDSYFINWYSC